MFRTDDTKFNRCARMTAITILTIIGALLVSTGQSSLNARQTNGQGRREVHVSNNSGAQKAGASREVRATWRSGTDEIEVRARNVELNDEETGIKSIAPDGYFVVEERRGGIERNLKVTRAADGRVQYSLFVQGEPRKFDGEAQQWLGEILTGFVRNSDFSTEARFRRIFKQHGARGIFEEVSTMTSDHSKRLYLQMLLAEHNQSPAVRVQALEQAGKEITSTYEKAELLLWMLGDMEMGAPARKAFFKAVDALEHDSDKGRVLAAVIKQNDPTGEVRRLALQSALHFKSEYDLAGFLIQLVKVRPLDATLRQEVLNAVKQLQSSYEQGRVLSALVESEKG
jgi:hypothetical protein